MPRASRRLVASVIAAAAAVALTGCGPASKTVPSAAGSPPTSTQPAPSPPPPTAAPPQKAASQTPPKPGLHIPTPASVRGIYLTGWTAGSPKRLKSEIAYLKANGLNAVVIDVKDDDGRLSFNLPGTAAEAIGASLGKIPHPKAVLEELHQNGIYVIGRIVTFADPYASKKYPQWSITENGKLWHDNRNITWLSPWSRKAWNYNIQIAVGAADLGFDEIQFDYIRLPAAILPGYNTNTTMADRVAQVTDFLKAATTAVHSEAHVPVSADIFGIDSVTEGDSGIGQRYQDIAHVVDTVSSMDYPSLYARNEMGIPRPVLRPYDTVWDTVAHAAARTPGLTPGDQRPWIQDFSLGVHYGAKQVDAELEALAGAGIHSFLMWNPNNTYTKNIAFSILDTTPIKPPSPTWLPAMSGLVGSGAPVLLPGVLPTLPKTVSLLSHGSHKGYRTSIWSTAAILPTNAAGVAKGTPLVQVAGASSEAGLPSMGASPGSGPSEAVTLGDGVLATETSASGGTSLTWHGKGAYYRVWATGTDAAKALQIANSMTPVTLLEDR